MAGLWGRNELRYRQKLAAGHVKQKDKHIPSIHECGNSISLHPAELEFLELKAPLMLYLLHQTLVKQSSAVGVVRILTHMLSDARSGSGLTVSSTLPKMSRTQRYKASSTSGCIDLECPAL